MRNVRIGVLEGGGGSQEIVDAGLPLRGKVKMR